MWRSVSKECEINVTGEGVTIDCSDMSEIRGQFELLLGTLGSTVLGFFFNVRPGGLLIEVTPATTLTAVTGTSSLSTTSINCKGYAQCMLRVTTPHGSAGNIGILTLSGYSEKALQNSAKTYIPLDSSPARQAEIRDELEGGGGVSGVPPSGGGPP